MSKKLSILTCTLKSRENLFHNLARFLKAQSTIEVELLANQDDGEKTIGHKRNELIDAAQGEYICFVDDDDIVSPWYTHHILKAIETQPDCVGIEGVITQPGNFPRKFIHSSKYKDWFEDNGVYYRCPNHLNPVKKELAQQVKFPNLDYHEDRDYSYRLFPFIKTEVYINEPIYYYYPSS